MVALVILCGIAMGFSALVSDAQETTPSLDATYVRYTGPYQTHGGLPLTVFNKIEDIPVEYARRMPNEVYFHWAKAKNAKTLAGVRHSVDPSVSVIQGSTGVTGTMPPSRGITSSSSGGNFRAAAGSKTVVREVTQPTYNGPITIYNPYFKGK